ncbi:MAG: SRPBCC domain-containing protein [Chryseolinea sp.]
MKNSNPAITVNTIIKAPIEKVWNFWTEPQHLVEWNNAFDDWHTPVAENDVRTGGKLKLRMEANDSSAGFDHEAIYDDVVKNEKIEYTTSDGRKSTILFTETKEGIQVVERFEPEDETPRDIQQKFVQSILNRFKAYVENH